MGLRLSEVLDHPDFGIELRCGGEAARLAPVDGAHCIDVRDPVRWLHEDWIMLTTGTQLRGSVSAQRRLVAQLADARIAALGLGLGIAMKRVPRAMVQEAGRREFPLFAVPLETPFREISSFVNRSVLSSEVHFLRRLTSMQGYLVDALNQPLPEEPLVERLAALLGGAEVVYLDTSGRPVAATAGALDWSEVAVAHSAPSVREFDQDGRWGLVVPVEGDTPAGWLAAVLPTGGVSRPVARSVARIASDLLGLISETRLAESRKFRARRARLRAPLLQAVAGGRADGLTAALASEGIDFGEPCRIAVLRADGDRTLSSLRERLELALEGGGAALVVAVEASRAVVLAQDDLVHMVDWLAPHPELADLRVGVSEPFARLEDAATATDQAELAVSVGVASAGPPAVVRHETVEPTVALLGVRSARPLRERLIATLDPLRDEPRLREAVVAYLAADLDVGRTAEALGLHRNSVRYRLDRAERLLGGSLRAPETVATIHLALVAERLSQATV